MSHGFHVRGCAMRALTILGAAVVLLVAATLYHNG